MIRPHLNVVRHLALYTSFHRGLGNKLIHGLATPLVFFSALCLLAWVGAPASNSLLHLGTPLAVVLFLLLATIDLWGALCVFALLLVACAVAGLAVASLPAVVLVPAAVALQLFAWWVAVVMGHERFEPLLQVGAQREDSNLYFRRRYYLAQNLGTAARPIDVVIQFSIAPLAVVQDALVFLGLRHRLERAVLAEQAQIVERLAEGRSPLAPAASQTHCPRLILGRAS